MNIPPSFSSFIPTKNGGFSVAMLVYQGVHVFLGALFSSHPRVPNPWAFKCPILGHSVCDFCDSAS